jgi:Holliday junction DNA helicase RuvA
MGDLDVLTRVPGVGRKTAQRLLLDLAQRLEGFESSPSDTADGTGDSDSARSEVREALAALGYGVDEVRDALDQITDGDDVQVLLRGALRVLAPHR